MTKAEKRKHEQAFRKLARRIRSLNAEIRSARAMGQREVRVVRERTAPLIENIRATNANAKAINEMLHTVAESLEDIGYDALIAFGLALGCGFWRRLCWGIRFGLTGRVK